MMVFEDMVMTLVARKHLFAGFSVALALAAPGAASAQAVFTTAPAGGGTLVVNQNTGAISYCVITSGGTGLAPVPTGTCGKIGTATPSATNPSLVISDWFISNTNNQFTAFITNVYTGKVVQCVYYYTAVPRVLYGDCALIATASS
jgi:hypothetical protein